MAVTQLGKGPTRGSFGGDALRGAFRPHFQISLQERRVTHRSQWFPANRCLGPRTGAWPACSDRCLPVVTVVLCFRRKHTEGLKYRSVISGTRCCHRKGCPPKPCSFNGTRLHEALGQDGPVPRAVNGITGRHISQSDLVTFPMGSFGKSERPC